MLNSLPVSTIITRNLDGWTIMANNTHTSYQTFRVKDKSLRKAVKLFKEGYALL